MALVKCEECGAGIAKSAKSCPQCGAAGPGVNRASYLWILLGLPLGAAGLLFALGMYGTGAKMRSAEEAIIKCRRSALALLPGTKEREIAEFSCEGLVDQFQAKYGKLPFTRHN